MYHSSEKLKNSNKSYIGGFWLLKDYFFFKICGTKTIWLLYLFFIFRKFKVNIVHLIKKITLK